MEIILCGDFHKTVGSTLWPSFLVFYWVALQDLQHTKHILLSYLFQRTKYTAINTILSIHPHINKHIRYFLEGYILIVLDILWVYNINITPPPPMYRDCELVFW